MFYTTPEYHDYNWTIRPDLDPELRAELIAAFTELDPANEVDDIFLATAVLFILMIPLVWLSHRTKRTDEEVADPEGGCQCRALTRCVSGLVLVVL